MSSTMAASPPDNGNNHPNGDNVDVNVDDSVARPPTPRRQQRDINDDAVALPPPTDHRTCDERKSIGSSAQHAVVWWKSTPIPSFPALDPRLPLHSQLPPNTFSLANTPVAQDTSAHTHALVVEALLGGPDIMAARVAPAHPRVLDVGRVRCVGATATMSTMTRWYHTTGSTTTLRDSHDRHIKTRWHGHHTFSATTQDSTCHPHPNSNNTTMSTVQRHRCHFVTNDDRA
ncbi:hypothetical protein EV363DRAFT_1421574 [Boletus edulis]|nr:hypothetical protein EV363DRAFT_1421574 [Boletus edulis]